jgi:hypothetical protein
MSKEPFFGPGRPPWKADYEWREINQRAKDISPCKKNDVTMLDILSALLFGIVFVPPIMWLIGNLLH